MHSAASLRASRGKALPAVRPQFAARRRLRRGRWLRNSRRDRPRATHARQGRHTPMRTGNSPPSGGKLRLLSITHSGRRRSGNARAAKQAKVARRGKIHERKSAARRQRKAAFNTARGPYRWPEWSLVAGAAAFIAWIVLVAISRGTLNWAGTTAVPMFLIWLFAALIAGP